MHFGFSIYSVTPSYNVLRVVSPIDGLMMIGMGIAVIFCAALFTFIQVRAKVAVPVFLLIALLTVGAASNGTVTLDAVHNTAEVHTVFFGYPKTYRYPLSSVTGAYVGSADQTDALRLMLRGGSELQLTPFNQMRGKSQAAFAINQFVGEHNGAGSPAGAEAGAGAP